MEIERLFDELELQELEAQKETREFVGSAIYIFLVVYFIFPIDVIMVDLLKWRGVSEEKDLEPFPKNLKGIVINMNHRDGNEWIFFYRKCFKAIYLIAPWLILRDIPYILADGDNFLKSPLTRFLGKRVIPVNRKDGTIKIQIKRSVSAMKKSGLAGFFEGTRTKKAQRAGRIVESPQKKKVLGELSELLGIFVMREGARIKSGWFEFPNSSFSSLPEDGKFRLKRFFLWYWRTLRRKNGKIIIIWGLTKDFKGEDKKEITCQIQKYELELADQI